MKFLRTLLIFIACASVASFATANKRKSSGAAALSSNTGGKYTTDQGFGTYTWGYYSTPVPCAIGDSCYFVEDSTSGKGIVTNNLRPAIDWSPGAVSIYNEWADSARFCVVTKHKNSVDSATFAVQQSFNNGSNWITTYSTTKVYTNSTSFGHDCFGFELDPGTQARIVQVGVTGLADTTFFSWAKLWRFHR